MDNTITDHELTEFVRPAEGHERLSPGDVDHYLNLLHHANGFTLLRPNGVPASRHEERAADLRSWPNPFRDGEAQLEHAPKLGVRVRFPSSAPPHHS